MATETMTRSTSSKVAPAASATKAAAPRAPLLASFVPPASVRRVVSVADLELNSGIGSSTGRWWVCVHGHVFDVTEFAPSHPGGPMIRLAAGRDATCLLESYHPPAATTRVEAALFHKANYIGRMAQTNAEGDKASKAATTEYKRPDDAFYRDVCARVDQLIASKGLSRYAYDSLGVLESVLTFALYVYAMYQVGVYGSWTWTLVLGVLTGRMGFLMHQGNHCAIARNWRINQVVGWFHDLIGSNAIIWGYEHQVAHHVEPNEYHRDNDCEIGAPTVRMHPDIPHTDIMRWQHILIPIAMTVGLIKWYLGDFSHFVLKKVGNVRMSIDWRDWRQLLGFKALWFVLHVAIPVYFNGWLTGLAQMFVFMGIGGHYLENIFIVNHIQNGLVPPPDAHWANKQVLATANWKSGSLFWNWVSGGLNHQVEHHMFPSLSYYWYPHVSELVRSACAAHGLPYSDYPSFGAAWMDMFRYLRDMGQPDFVAKDGRKGAVAEKKAKSN